MQAVLNCHRVSNTVANARTGVRAGPVAKQDCEATPGNGRKTVRRVKATPLTHRRRASAGRTNSTANWRTVLEPKMLPGFIEQEPGNVAPADVTLASFHLSRYLRADAEKNS